MIAWILGLPGRLRLWVAAIVAVVVLSWIAIWRIVQAQRAIDAGQRAQDSLDALDRGRRAVAEGQASGETPDQRVQGNDGAWR